MKLTKIAAAVSIALLSNTTYLSFAEAAPVTTHPRLWITQEDLPRLRSWAAPTNPMYVQALSKTVADAINVYNTAFFPGGQPNPQWPDNGGVTWPGKATEQYAMLFAFMSMIDPAGDDVRAQHAERARNLLMYVMNKAAQGHADAPFRHPAFATYDRGRVYFEGFPLTVDWIYDAVDTLGQPVLSANDKATIRKVFMMWAEDANKGNINGLALKGTDPATLFAHPVELRKAMNNYYSGRTRNLTLMALSMDAVNDPPIDASRPETQVGNTLRSYLSEATDKWLLSQYAMYESPDVLAQTLDLDAATANQLGKASGGLSPEGFMYGDCLAFVSGGLLGLHTAGYNDTSLIGPQAGLINSTFWDRHVDTLIQSLTPISWVPADAKWMGKVYGAAAFGDTHFAYVHSDHLAHLGIYDYKVGNTERLKKIRWIATDVAAGGKESLFRRANPSSGGVGTTPVLHFMLFDPTDPESLNPPDPRPLLPTSFYDQSLGRLVMRTDWTENASLFDYKCSYATINHQNADCNQFELYRNGEWLTKEHTNYDIWGLGQLSDYHNTLSLENDMPATIVWGEKFFQRGSQLNNGASVGDPTVVTSSGDGYVFAQGDATNLYNHKEYNPANWSVDIQHASRSIVWLKPDHVVIYDRAISKTPNRFKRFNLNFVNNPVITGQTAHAVTPKGQNIYLQRLLPANAALTTLPIEKMNTTASLEPTQWRLVVEDPSRPADVRFLHVLQGADAQGAMDTASPFVSDSGTSYQGTLVRDTAVLFPVVLGAPASAFSYTVPDTTKAHLITGLQPGAGYSVAMQFSGLNVQVAVSAGGSFIADTAGVVVVTDNSGLMPIGLTPQMTTVAATGGTASVSVSALGNTPWTATTSTPWMTLMDNNGTGDGKVRYTVAQNTTNSARTGTIDINGQLLTVQQNGLTCTLQLSPKSLSFGNTSGSANITVSTQPGCAWTANSNTAWATIAGGTSGNGNGSIMVNVAANTSASRTGTLTIAGQSVNVAQAGAAIPPTNTGGTPPSTGTGTTPPTDGSGQKTQTIAPITFTQPLAVTKDIPINTSASSGLLVSFRSETPTICTVSDSKSYARVTGIMAGDCVISAHQAGDAKYAAAPSIISPPQPVGKGDQNIYCSSLPASLAVNAKFGLGATYTTSKLPVSFRVEGASAAVCTVTPTTTNNAVVQGIAPGTCTVIVEQSGNASYNTAQLTRTTTIK